MTGHDDTKPPDTLTYRGSYNVIFRNCTYQSVHLKVFTVSGGDEDRRLLAALIEHWRYRDGYLADNRFDEGQLHGPYGLEHITVDAFTQIDPASAEADFRRRADQYAPLDEFGCAQLDRDLYPRIRQATSIYRLNTLAQDTKLDFGWILGDFHELVLINRIADTITLAVISED